MEIEKDFFDYLSIIGSLTISTLTLIFAIIIYRKISFKKTAIEKQFDTVSQLIQVLQDTSISFIKKNDDLNFSLPRSIPFFSISSYSEKLKYLEGLDIYFTKNFYDNLPFIKYSKTPFIPKNIASVIEKFKLVTPDRVNLEGLEKYVKIDFSHSSIISPIDETLITCPHNEICVDYNSFYNVCLQLDSEIREWLESYGVKDLNLR